MYTVILVGVVQLKKVLVNQRKKWRLLSQKVQGSVIDTDANEVFFFLCTKILAPVNGYSTRINLPRAIVWQSKWVKNNNCLYSWYLAYQYKSYESSPGMIDDEKIVVRPTIFNYWIGIVLGYIQIGRIKHTSTKYKNRTEEFIFLRTKNVVQKKKT